jgi:energy-coupling factor transport system substrate-specific component
MEAPAPSRRGPEVREIVTIALLAAVGGVLSTYVGYLGNLINRLFGVPFGAGQLIAGLHVLWPVLARLLLRRFGVGTLTGVTKGLVEFLSGGTHGVVILVVSAIEGLLVDLGLGSSRRASLLLTMAAGAVASASNVFVFQAIYFSGVAMSFIFVMAGLSLVSGAVLGGYLAWDLRRLLIAAGLVRAAREPGDEPRRRIRWGRHVATLAVVSALLAGGVFYFITVYEPFAAPGAVRVMGAVSAPGTFEIDTWEGDEVTVIAELRGSVSYSPPAPYTGVRLADLLARAKPREDATRVRVVAGDGYEARFVFADAMLDDELLLVVEDGDVRLIAARYDGAYWVRKVTRIVID